MTLKTRVLLMAAVAVANLSVLSVKPAFAGETSGKFGHCSTCSSGGGLYDCCPKCDEETQTCDCSTDGNCGAT